MQDVNMSRSNKVGFPFTAFYHYLHLALKHIQLIFLHI